MHGDYCHCDACSYRIGYKDGEKDGRREMLWLMAVGLEMTCYLAQCSEHSMSEIWHGWLRDKALRALSARGDEQAAKLLKETP